MVDYVVAVDDPISWHAENLRTNSRHYSRLMRILGARGLDRLAQWGVSCHFNTNVPAPWLRQNTKRGEQSCKYCVIGVEQLEHDMQNWSSLYVAGRLHKPVLSLKVSCLVPERPPVAVPCVTALILRSHGRETHE